MSYEAFRHFADSFWLAFMACLYLALIGWVFMPRQRDANDRAAQMIFDEDQDDG